MPARVISFVNVEFVSITGERGDKGRSGNMINV